MGLSIVASKYTSGRVQFCPRCGARPCCCDDPAPDSPAPIPMPPRAKAGNAIPFVVWDKLIAKHDLSIYESGVLLYLCRKTIGYGQHNGADIGSQAIATDLRISKSSVLRALEYLVYCGLIERTVEQEAGRTSYKRGWIKVRLGGD